MASRVVTVTHDGLSYDVGGGVDTVRFDAGNEVVSFVGGLADSAPTVSDIDDPWGTAVIGTLFEWDGVALSVFGGVGDLRLRAAEIGGARLQTVEGIAVGSTRAEAMAAGAWADWDEDGDGVADHLGIGPREVPGTSSYAKPGSVGIEYVLLTIDDDVVTEIRVPVNDFSDI
jgi:hypothetical protein